MPMRSIFNVGLKSASLGGGKRGKDVKRREERPLENNDRGTVYPMGAVAGCVDVGCIRSLAIVVSVHFGVDSAPFCLCRMCRDSGESLSDADVGSCGRLIAPHLPYGTIKHALEKCIQRWIERGHPRK